jgi:hypothetical protein
VAEQRRPSARLAGSVAAAIALLVAIVLVIVLAVGSNEPPPAIGAAQLVPASALLYVNISTDPTRPAVKRALAVAQRLPGSALLTSAFTTRLDSILAGSRPSGAADFDADVRPWLGDEAAFAVLNTTTSTAGSLIVLSIRNHARARAFLNGAGAAPHGSYRAVALLREPSGTTLAFVRGYLILGQPASVRAAIDVAAGGAPALAGSSVYRRAASGEPADRVIDGYVSGAGVARLLAVRPGLLGVVGTLLQRPSLGGVTISISAVSPGARIRLHSVLTQGAKPPPSISPTLTAAMPAGSTVVYDAPNLARAAPRILAAGAVLGIGGRIGPLLHRLGSALASEGVNVSQITSIFSGETAVALMPAGAGRGPAIVIAARTLHQARTRALLAQLEVPLAQLFPAPVNGPGVAPEVGNVGVAGVTAHQLALGPGLQLDYAVFNGMVVVSTSLRAIAEVARHSESLPDESAYQATLAGGPSQLTSLLFLDFSQLLRFGEQTGLIRGTVLTVLTPDLQRIRAIGLTSTGGESDTTAELLLQIT